MTERLIVTTYRPGRTRKLIAGGLLSLVAVAAVSYLLGLKVFDVAMAEKRELKKMLQAADKRANELKQALANAEITTRIDRDTLEQVRREVAELQSNFAKQEEELSFYRNLLKDSGEGNGLYIDSLKVWLSPDNPMVYGYRLVLRQKNALIKPVDAEFELSIEGEQAGKATVIALSELDSGVAAMPIKINFKYFQVIEGEMRLPPGFVPRIVKSAIWQLGKRSKGREQQFNWSVQEA